MVKKLRLGEGEEGEELQQMHGLQTQEAMTPTFMYARHWLETWLEKEVGLEHSPSHADKRFLPICFTWKCVHQEYIVAAAQVTCMFVRVNLRYRRFLV
jgi:hypothetical protein